MFKFNNTQSKFSFLLRTSKTCNVFFSSSGKGKESNSENTFTDFSEFVFKRKSEDTNSTDYNSESQSKSHSTYTPKSPTQSILHTRRINLAKVYQKDLLYFKIEDSFKLIDLKRKYLQLAKLYHPDIRSNEKLASTQFTRLQQSYERLKQFHKLKEELVKIEEDLINGNGIDIITMTEDQKRTIEDINEEALRAMNMEGIIDKDKWNLSKDEFIRQLLIEDEFGDIKEPKYALQFLIAVWVVIGVLVFYIDLRKYLIKLRKRREGVDYS